MRAWTNIEDLDGLVSIRKDTLPVPHKLENGLALLFGLIVAVDCKCAPAHPLKVTLVTWSRYDRNSFCDITAQTTRVIVVMMSHHHVLDRLAGEHLLNFVDCGFRSAPTDVWLDDHDVVIKDNDKRIAAAFEQ